MIAFIWLAINGSNVEDYIIVNVIHGTWMSLWQRRPELLRQRDQLRVCKRSVEIDVGRAACL